MKFTKVTGLGNDFILFDNRHRHFSGEEREFFSKICQRRVSIGADGVILLENSQNANFKYRHFNADGSLAEMCGNGARTICYYAVKNGLAPENLSFEVEGVIYEAVVSRNRVMLKMPPPTEISTQTVQIDEKNLESGGFVQIGVPHLVVFTDNVDTIDVDQIGRRYRFYPHFKNGANVNFIQLIDDQTIKMRTYERGVEAETLACGTGATSSAIISHLVKKLIPPITVKMPGGNLTIDWESDFKTVFLEGEATIVYYGELVTPDFE
jgi:diaminopimelate epimerase